MSNTSHYKTITFLWPFLLYSLTRSVWCKKCAPFIFSSNFLSTAFHCPISTISSCLSQNLKWIKGYTHKNTQNAVEPLRQCFQLIKIINRIYITADIGSSHCDLDLWPWQNGNQGICMFICTKNTSVQKSQVPALSRLCSICHKVQNKYIHAYIQISGSLLNFWITSLQSIRILHWAGYCPICHKVQEKYIHAYLQTSGSLLNFCITLLFSYTLPPNVVSYYITMTM